jgi:tetratricopeptide (TPR) repeat protein
MNTFLIIAIVLIILYLIGKSSSKKKYEKFISEGTYWSNLKLDNLLKRANEKGITNDFRGAVAITDKVLLLQPDNYMALVCRANSLEALNFNLDAIDDYEMALSIDNSDGNIYGLLGLTYNKIGDIENGLRCLKLSIDKGIKQYEMNYNIIQNAPDVMKQAVAKRGNSPEKHLRRNPDDFFDNLSQVDKDELKQAIKDSLHRLEASLAKDPENMVLKNLHEFAKKIIT